MRCLVPVVMLASMSGCLHHPIATGVVMAGAEMTGCMLIAPKLTETDDTGHNLGRCSLIVAPSVAFYAGIAALLYSEVDLGQHHPENDPPAYTPSFTPTPVTRSDDSDDDSSYSSSGDSSAGDGDGPTITGGGSSASDMSNTTAASNTSSSGGTSAAADSGTSSGAAGASSASGGTTSSSAAATRPPASSSTTTSTTSGAGGSSTPASAPPPPPRQPTITTFQVSAAGESLDMGHGWDYSIGSAESAAQTMCRQALRERCATGTLSSALFTKFWYAEKKVDSHSEYHGGLNCLANCTVRSQ